LMRYDGYYLFADWVDVPNLSQQASQAVRRWWQPYFLKRVADEMPLDADLRFLRIYAVAAFAYRTMVIGLLLWFVYKTFKANDLAPVGDMVVFLAIAGFLLQPAIGLARWWRRPMAIREIRTKRFAFAAATFGLLALLGLQIPWASRVSAPVLAQLDDAHRIYASVSGRIETAVACGTEVATGDTLAVLINEELDLRRVE
ncbi:MAG: hypothetical protein ACIALR_08930, partial [Blastopirellula sp. JB062]